MNKGNNDRKKKQEKAFRWATQRRPPLMSPDLGSLWSGHRLRSRLEDIPLEREEEDRGVLRPVSSFARQAIEVTVAAAPVALKEL
ncbi:g1793 [Coccomyxa elongata]